MIKVTVDYEPACDKAGVEFYFEEYYEMTDFIKQAQEYSNHTYLIEFFETEATEE